MKTNEMVIRADARSMGAVTALNTRVAPRWTPTPKALRFKATEIDGVAVPANVVSQLVKVTNGDGTVEYRSASSFRSKHISKRNKQHKSHKQQINERIMAADLAPIGNVE